MGPSNSPSAFTKSTFGVDTVAIAFTGLGGTDIANRVENAAALRHGRGHLLLDSHPSGARVVWYPEPCTLKIEGRLSALSTSNQLTTRLGTRNELRSLPDRAAGVCSALLGIPSEQLRQERHHLTRLDTTGELTFSDHREGLALLSATAGLVPPGYKGSPIYRSDGQIETMYVLTAKRGRKVARFYDSGVHHETAKPGELIRYEVQNRWAKAQAHTPATMSHSAYTLPQLFARHLEPFTTHAQEITVTTATDAPAQIARKIATGELTPRQASGMAGFVAMLPYGGRHLFEPQSARRYLRLLREHGIVLTGTEQEAALTVGQALDELLRGATAVCEADRG
jgi:hypothetical protein